MARISASVGSQDVVVVDVVVVVVDVVEGGSCYHYARCCIYAGYYD